MKRHRAALPLYACCGPLVGCTEKQMARRGREATGGGSLLLNGPAAVTYGVKAAGIATIAGRPAMSSFHDLPRAGRPDWRKYAFALAFGVATVIAALIQRYWL